MNKAIPETDLDQLRFNQQIERLKALDYVDDYNESYGELILKSWLTFIPVELINFHSFIKILHIPNFQWGYIGDNFSKFDQLDELYLDNSNLLNFPPVFSRINTKVLSMTNGILNHVIADYVSDTIVGLFLDGNKNLDTLEFGFHKKQNLQKISALGTKLQYKDLQKRVQKWVEVILDDNI